MTSILRKAHGLACLNENVLLSLFYMFYYLYYCHKFYTRISLGAREYQGLFLLLPGCGGGVDNRGHWSHVGEQGQRRTLVRFVILTLCCILSCMAIILEATLILFT